MEFTAKRKLAAILSADVKGYSRLMGDDEEATVDTLERFRELMSALILQYRGRVVDSPGDNLLAEFASVVDAIRCAWEIQQKLAAHNRQLPHNRQMVFRIGINLGDVIEEKGRLYGDGVNLAARLEGLAEPGGIHLSGSAYEQVKHKLPYQFEFAGKQRVKNIRDPVNTYRVVMDPQTAPGSRQIEKPDRRTLYPGGLLLTAIVAALAVGLYWWIDMHADSLKDSRPKGGELEPLLAQRASIAVLPFKNLSGDPQQEYFSDGITNDIITDLSRFSNLLVIASNTVFSYKSKTMKIKTIGQELGVKYILEGSIWKIKDNVRINARLIDAANETHVWAKRYERNYDDIFTLQVDLVQAIVSNLAININQTEQIQALRKTPQDLQAYDFQLQGWAHLQRRTRASTLRAGERFQKAVDLDPNYAAAYVGLGWVNYYKVSYGWTEFPRKALQSAFDLGRKAVELDASNAEAHTLLCNVYTFQNKYDLAIREAERAIELNPNDAIAYSQLGWAFLWAGKLNQAQEALEMSLRLDSASTRNVWLHLGMVYYLQEQYEEGLKTLETGVTRRPDFAGYYIMMAATYARLDRNDEAEQAADMVLRLDPFFEIESFGTAFRNPSHRKAIKDGLRKTGLN